MAEGVVEAFDVVGKAAVFASGDMAVFGEDLGIGFPIVRVAAAAELEAYVGLRSANPTHFKLQ
jgi:hypothetical protein